MVQSFACNPWSSRREQILRAGNEPCSNDVPTHGRRCTLRGFGLSGFLLFISFTHTSLLGYYAPCGLWFQETKFHPHTIRSCLPVRTGLNCFYGILCFELGILITGWKFIAYRQWYTDFNAHVHSFIYTCHAKVLRTLVSPRMHDCFVILIICLLWISIYLALQFL